MKLLIVDDEELTRQGLISSIDWKALGIDEVLQADDGVNGLEAARLHRPEIILCDVRMPRMTGIAMLEQLEKILPDSIPIFMSGYSDKEYLKAAIRLKTVSYIEKPLNPDEIREAVQEAIRLYRQKMHTHRGEALHIREQASRLALLLSSPYHENRQVIDQLVQELSLDIRSSTAFTSIAVRLSPDSEPDVPSADDIFRSIREYLDRYHLSCIYTERRSQYLIYFLFGPDMPSNGSLKAIREFFLQKYSVFRRFSISAGEAVTGISRAYQSYASAVILLQSSFFFPANSFLSKRTMTDEPCNCRTNQPDPDPAEQFSGYLLARNHDGCLKFFEMLSGFYDRNIKILPNQARSQYYSFFQALEDAGTRLQTSFSLKENIVDILEKCFTWQELHNRLIEETEIFFDTARNSFQEKSTIFLIRDYISRNYMNESLSVKDISSHVFLSPSYLCTYFKNETGQTLNQYLTEFRMEKARQLLADPRYRISEISARVGYSDGNYFSKSFKKYTGLSPSEYREKML